MSKTEDGEYSVAGIADFGLQIFELEDSGVRDSGVGKIKRWRGW